MGAPRGLSSLGLGDEPASDDEGERESLTSEILAGGSDWAAEFLLLTHEPLRRDMDEMTRALQPSFFGYLPESRRVRAFFRYFQGWCSLVAQQHAVEIAVHVDWLGAAKTTQSTGGPPALADDYRIGLMDYQRGVELALLNVSRMEARIIEELTMAADWNTTDPWSQQVCWGTFWGARPPSPPPPLPPRRLTPSPVPSPSQADELRNMLDELFTTMRDHLSQQETKLPAIFRDKGARSRRRSSSRARSPPRSARRRAARAAAPRRACSRGWCTTSACATRRGPSSSSPRSPSASGSSSRSRRRGTPRRSDRTGTEHRTHPLTPPIIPRHHRYPKLLDYLNSIVRDDASDPDAADRRALRASIVAGSTSRNLAAAAAEGEEGEDHAGTTRVQRPSIERGESQLSHPAPRHAAAPHGPTPASLSLPQTAPRRCGPLATRSPRPRRSPAVAHPLAGGPDGGLDYARAAGERREQQRRAGAVSAVLAAANARRDIASAQARATPTSRGCSPSRASRRTATATRAGASTTRRSRRRGSARGCG